MDNNDYLEQLQATAEDVLQESVENISFVSIVSVYTTDEPAFVQERVPIIDGLLKRCASRNVIDVSGRDRTGASARKTWRLREFISPCDSAFHSFDRPLSFVASPHSGSPVILTVVPKEGILAPPDDVVIEVFTWNTDGGKAPNISFSWRCRVPFFNQIP